MTAEGNFVEVQGTGEEASFSEQELADMIGLGKLGIRELFRRQKAAVAS
jgi:ribonuclease PH